MGALSSRRDAGAEELDTPPGSVYRYPPKSGNYFASHFIMGGQTFDSAHPEGYLFGENSDLNFLGSHPVIFPYAAPPPQDPVKTLRSLISIRKDTLRLVRCERRCREELQTPTDETTAEETPDSNISYNVEFTFDADAQVAITIYYQAMEEFLDGCASYTSKDSSLQSETVRYKRGVCQHFCLPTHTIDPSDWMDEELACNADSTVYPMVIHAVVDEGEEHLGHSHVLLNTFDKNADGNCSVKPLKQKQVVDGVSYLLQEIYGIENKYNGLQCKVPSDELSDNSAECVVCLSDIRDTLILPCRHLCLCNACADTLRYQANNCPICRLPFRALLQIRAMRKKVDPLPPDHPDPVIASHLPVSDDQPSSDHIPRGYEVVSLLEALNGPLSPPSAPPMHPVRDGSAPCPKPSRGPEEQTPSQGSSSPLDQGTEVCTGLQAKESESRPVSQNSLVLVDKEEGRCRSEGDIPGVLQGHFQEVEDTGMTPESENVTLSSPGVMEPSSHSPTVLSSSITSPEDPSSLTPSVMSMASFQLSTDTMSSMSGSYSFHDDGSLAECDPTQHPTLLSVEEQEGNAVAKDPHRDTVQDSRLHGWWDRRALTPVCDNNNELPRMATLDNDPCLEGTAADPAQDPGWSHCSWPSGAPYSLRLSSDHN
ncbi:E3 ubiquitin ligase RNF157 isoform X2 [Narcine bancroftii]|uniref:E3 ubiquitin ligase RNF157 isoform X2 n=1 Tax=Narcine bancroftii TaxID=1343680 RepID=UPI0038322B0A